MIIATWNINGVKARLATLVKWLELRKPDVVCLQEIKSQDEGFPREPIEALGYKVETHGQKGFNGVAILARVPLEDVERGLPGDALDVQSRFMTALVGSGHRPIRVASLYLPNGNPLDSPKYDYKLAFMDRLHAHAQTLLKDESPFVIAGDYNVIPTPMDARHPEQWSGDALFQPAVRCAFRELVNLGLTDAVRATSSKAGLYTFWDYQAGSWPKNNGIRIDHALLSPPAADRLISAHIDTEPRGWETPSDHVPVLVELAD